MKILITGGRWRDMESVGAPTAITAYIAALLGREHDIDVQNGGTYQELCRRLYDCEKYDIVFWLPDISNLTEACNPKDVAPYIMLVTAHWNPQFAAPDHVQHMQTLREKANLTFEFDGHAEDFDNIKVYDPLACYWYIGNDAATALKYAMRRLEYLRSITRQKTVPSNQPGLMLQWYFDAFKQPETSSDKIVNIPDETAFVQQVEEYSKVFYQLMGIEMPTTDAQAPQVGRCAKGMPSFKSGDYVFVSPRTALKKHIAMEDFIPVYIENEMLHHCSEVKPSVDSPIHMKLYQNLPNIKYILHSHHYVEGAPFTTKCIPCGAIEEATEVIEAITRAYGALDGTAYKVNCLGHGSFIMASTVDELKGMSYYKRPRPELMEVSL